LHTGSYIKGNFIETNVTAFMHFRTVTNKSKHSIRDPSDAPRLRGVPSVYGAVEIQVAVISMDGQQLVNGVSL